MEAHGEDAPLEPEEAARAAWYGVLSRLLYAPPESDLLESLSAAESEGEHAEAGSFVEAWGALQRACGAADPEAVREEYETLFVSVGRAPVTPYTSAYAAPHGPERHLVALRTRLGSWGLTRHDRVFEAEDHIAALCDAMRWLIVRGHDLEEQRGFFDEYIARAAPAFCDAINRAPDAVFYRAVSQFLRAYVRLEQDAFDMHTPS